ncbi:efflux RND transporter periplasmic adaptor subunit [Massilia horti]|uniref:Efflux RND transporter periplasmic adaptor subunit n=1 Tax=Massilia horti TaxID=2562153 RepID=A0A4Y9TA44_9BURK|nr:efflux RND transporter periplasmic adaptor subunit [Massilia horti]TFW36220.1 efflux RND transporter periplasmic adaptor subunit [Massilia horti]
MRSATSSSPSLTRVAACTLVALTLLSACGSKNNAAQPPGGKMPAPEVGVITTKLQPVALETELPARVGPIRVSQVRARVNGVVLKRLFTEGGVVKEGQSLFQIDPAPYQAQVNSAQAALAKAEANLSSVSATLERYVPLLAAEAVSKQEYTNTVAAKKQAEADVGTAKAALQIARINRDYANVYAPISGRIGQALVTEGALVSTADTGPMAVIQQLDKVYLNITQSANELQHLRRQAGEKNIASGLPVSVVLDDGSVMPRKGRLLFSDVTVDPSTGQVTLRAEMPNPDYALLPGQYVRVRLAQAELPAGILVPQQAVTRGGPQGDTLLVVGQDGKPMQRIVKIGSQNGANWVVTDGLQAGEQVVVDGFQKLQMMPPGTPVKAVPWSPTPAPEAAGPAAGAKQPAAADTASR